MEIYVHKNNEDQMHYGSCAELKAGFINVILFETGFLELPDEDQLVGLEVIFSKDGKFLFESNKPIRIGSVESRWMKVEIGKMGFDCQPRFIFVPNEQKWLILSRGLYTALEECPNEL